MSSRARSPALRAAVLGLGLGLGLAPSPLSGATTAPPAGADASIRSASLATILAEAKASRAPAVLVNVWATWCDPCREEMPDLLRFLRDHRAAGLRLVLISADDPDAGPEVRRALATATAQAGVAGTPDAALFIKQDDDMKLIDGLDPRWSGALPATFLFDDAGRRIHSWLTPIKYADLEPEVARLTKPAGKAKRNAAGRSDTQATTQTPRRKP
jgi:thiol-disulfide isomerase/thioredoxin